MGELTVGIFNGQCNRTSCRKPGAKYYNHSTEKYYCGECAKTINMHNLEHIKDFGHPLCTYGEYIPGTGKDIADTVDQRVNERLIELIKNKNNG